MFESNDHKGSTKCKYNSKSSKQQEIIHSFNIPYIKIMSNSLPVCSENFFGKGGETFYITICWNKMEDDFAICLSCCGPNPELYVQISFVFTSHNKIKTTFGGEFKFKQNNLETSKECFYENCLERPSDYDIICFPVGTKLIIECKIIINYPTVLQMMFDNPKYSDFTLQVGSKSLKVHKAILAAESSVFAAMFDNPEMLENQQNKCDIKDIQHNVIKAMIEYIYTGKCMNLNKIAADLLVAADKYDLVALKTVCEEKLCSKIGDKNVADMLLLADRYNAKDLKTAVLNYFASNISDVIASNNWKSAKLPDYLLKDVINFLGNVYGSGSQPSI